VKISGKIKAIFILWGLTSGLAAQENSSLGPFRFNNLFFKGNFGTGEELIDNLKQNPYLASWDTVGAQNMTNVMGLVGYKYRSFQTQLSYLGNIMLSDYRLISHAVKLQDNIKLGRYALVNSGVLFSLATGKTIPDTNTFIDSRVLRGDVGLGLYLTKQVTTKTGFQYTILNEQGGDQSIIKDFSHTMNYLINPKKF